MAVCSDREDTNSICLTVVHRLLKNYKIDRQSIGLLVVSDHSHVGTLIIKVGTESSLDKSKSVKSQLMQLFPDNETMAGELSLCSAFMQIARQAWIASTHVLAALKRCCTPTIG